MTQGINKKVARDPDEIKALLKPLLNQLVRQAENERLSYVAEKAQNGIEMLEGELEATRKQNMRSQTKRRKRLADTPQIKKLYDALIIGTSAKKEDIEHAIKAVHSFDKKYKPETNHDFSVRDTLKELVGLDKISHKFNYTAEQKTTLANAFKTIAGDLETTYLETYDYEDEDHEDGHDAQATPKEERFRNIPPKIRGEHLLARYQND